LIVSSEKPRSPATLLVVAGYLIANHGIQSMLYLALGGLALGVLIMLFLEETAPRKLARKS
jgi:hypothetical protein